MQKRSLFAGGVVECRSIPSSSHPRRHQAKSILRNATEQSRLYDEALAATPGFTTARYHATLNRIERAEAAASGDTALATTLVLAAQPLAAQFPHLSRRVEALCGKLHPPLASPFLSSPAIRRSTVSDLRSS